MFKVNKRNIGTRCEICSKLIIKTPERRHRSGVLIINFEHISRLVLVFLFLTLSRQMPTGSVFIEKTTERSSRSFYVHLFKDLWFTPSWMYLCESSDILIGLCEWVFMNHPIIRSSRPEVFCKKDALRNFVKLIGKDLCQSFFFTEHLWTTAS